MCEMKERYVVDENGTRIAVIIDIETYRKMLEELEVLDLIRIYDEVKANPGEAIPFEQAIKEIESRHQ